ncbi:MAG: SDR family oxidoreductase [Methanotrichaceae archaeon]|nr:SDR family oxidoreductase [Methanotrichaceae archaeon]
MTVAGKRILVTGSTDGIGKQTALGLARMGANVLLHGRDKGRVLKVRDEIAQETDNHQLDVFIADLSSQKQVLNLAAEVADRHEHLHVLVNNAGTYSTERILTEDGLEMTFSVNYLAPFLLTRQLLELLKKSAPSRIVNVASIAHWNANVDWNNTQGEKYFDGFQAYALSKLGVVLFTYELAKRLKGTGVTVNCLHPGVVRTKLLRAGFGAIQGITPEEGARTSIYLASSSDLENVSGKYFESGRQVRSSPLSNDNALQEKFWKMSEKLVASLKNSY